MSSTSENIAGQTETTYQDYQKLKQLVDLGYFLQNYVVSGGEVTKDVTQNNYINITEIVVSLDNDVTRREAYSFRTGIANATYYLDYTADGDFNFGTAHYSGTYLPVAEITTDSNKNVLVITDKRGAVGQFRLKPTLPLPGYLRMVNVSDYGATGNGTDETAALQSAVTASLAQEPKALYFPNGAYVASDLTGIDEVLLLGDASTLSIGGVPKKIEYFGYNTQLDHTSAIYSKAMQEMNVAPRGSMTVAERAVSGGEVRIALWGDSLTDPIGGDVNDFKDKYSYRLEKSMRQSLPIGTSFTFGNFGLLSRNLSQAIDPNYKAVATEIDFSGFQRSWSTPGKSWRDHLKDFRPDLLIVAFGMNDSSSLTASETFYNNLSTLKTFIDTWDKKPSIVIVPTFVPTSDMSRYGQRVDVTQSVARAAREFGRVNGYYIADVNRLHNILRFGKDTDSCSNDSEYDFKYFSTDKWSGDKSSFVLTNGVLTSASTNKMVKRERNFYNGFIKVDITPHATGINGVGRIEYRGSDMGTYILLVHPGSGTGLIQLYENGTQLTFTDGLNIPVESPSNIKIVADGPNHAVYLNDILVLSYTGYKMFHDGVVSVGGDNVVPTFSGFQIGYSEPLTGVPIYNEDELLGPLNNGLMDGNGINHPTGMGYALFYEPAFNGVVNALSRVDNKGLLLPGRILAASWIAAPGGYPATTTAGESLYFNIVTKYNKNRGVALRRADNYSYYALSSVAVSQATLESLEPGKFVYYNSDATNDLIWISVPGGGTISDMELYRYNP